MRAALTILAAALLTTAAVAQTRPPAKAPAAKAPAAKTPAAKAPAPKAPPAKTATPAGPYDAQNPQSLVDELTAAGARATPGRRDQDAVFVTVTSTAANFSVQFAGCDDHGRACRAALFDNLLDQPAPTLSQVNSFNQTSVMCRVYLDRASKPHVLYSAVLQKSDNREAARLHLAAWQGCIVDARAFLADPVGFLANAA